MKKELVSILVFIVCAMFAEATAMAQGIIVHKKNGEEIILPYSTLDSIETYTEDVEEIDGHECVDLGLSVKWATTNVGAAIPSDYGDYFAWAEVNTKSEYTEENCSTYNKDIPDIKGNPTYDVARAKWGSTWRMPTATEMQELRDSCTWRWTSQDGVEGVLVIGPNGNSIFLPAAGFRTGTATNWCEEHGFYWSSQPYTTDLIDAYYLFFNRSSQNVDWSGRNNGHSVRPVSK